MDQIRSRFSELAVLAGGGDGAVTAEQFAEEAASVDEQLLEKYIETGYDESVWNERIRELTAERKFFSVRVRKCAERQRSGGAHQVPLSLHVGPIFRT